MGTDSTGDVGHDGDVAVGGGDDREEAEASPFVLILGERRQ